MFIPKFSGTLETFKQQFVIGVKLHHQKVRKEHLLKVQTLDLVDDRSPRVCTRLKQLLERDASPVMTAAIPPSSALPTGLSSQLWTGHLTSSLITREG